MRVHARDSRRSTFPYARLALVSALGALIFFVALSLALPNLAVAAPTGWETTQITTASRGSYAPDTDGEWLVWLRMSEGFASNELMVRNLFTGETRQVTNDGKLKTGPLVNDDTIIWSTYAIGSDDVHGYLYHLPNGPTEDLGPIPQPPNSYDHGRFTYRKTIEGQLRDEIYVYDLASKESTLITANGGYPSLRGSSLAYASFLPGQGYQLYLRDLDSGQTKQVSSGTESVTDVYLGETQLVWAEGTLDEMDLYLLDRTSNQARRLTDDSYEDREPRVADNLVVWESLRSDWEVVAYDIGTRQTVQLTDNDTRDMRPCTADGTVYWQGEVGLDLVYELFRAQPSERPFVDVAVDHYYVEAIEGLFWLHIVDGRRIVDGKRYYDPDEPVNRAQFAKMVTGSLGVPIESAGGAAIFVDLGDPDANGYPHKYVATILTHGVTQGIDATHYGPWRPIKRAQVVTMLVRAAKNLRAGIFEDPPAGYAGSVPSYTSPDHSQNLRIAEFNGLLDHLQGFGPGWDPEAAANRAECAQLMWNYILLVGMSM